MRVTVTPAQREVMSTPAPLINCPISPHVIGALSSWHFHPVLKTATRTTFVARRYACDPHRQGPNIPPSFQTISNEVLMLPISPKAAQSHEPSKSISKVHGHSKLDEPSGLYSSRMRL